MIAFDTTNRNRLFADMTLEEFEELLKGNWEFVDATMIDNGEYPCRVRCMHIVSWWEHGMLH